MAAVSQDEAKALEAAFEAAQARTSAPLMGVVAQSSSDYAPAPLAVALLLTLAAPWPLLLFTHVSAERIFAVQLALALAALAIFSVPRLRAALSGKRAQRAKGHRAAIVQFATRIGGHAGGANGALIYVSLAEHYVRVVPGAEAGRRIPAPEWQRLVDRLTAGIAKGELAAALARAAAEAADMLAPHFPPSADTAAKGGRFHSA
jgi:putative membrane protein